MSPALNTTPAPHPLTQKNLAVVYDLPPGLPLGTTVTAFALSALGLIQAPLSELSPTQVTHSAVMALVVYLLDSW